jgi:hypothetical protein
MNQSQLGKVRKVEGGNYSFLSQCSANAINELEITNTPGLGLVQSFEFIKVFMLAPESVYSHRFRSVNANPMLSPESGLYIHQASLRFKFMH